MSYETQRAALIARRSELAVHLYEVEHDLDQAMPADWEDRASERQGDEVLEALGTAELNQLKRIDAALARIEAGTYGTCMKCGDPIDAARLALVPEAPLCAACAR